MSTNSWTIIVDTNVFYQRPQAFFDKLKDFLKDNDAKLTFTENQLGEINYHGLELPTDDNRHIGAVKAKRIINGYIMDNLVNPAVSLGEEIDNDTSFGSADKAIRIIAAQSENLRNFRIYTMDQNLAGDLRVKSTASKYRYEILRVDAQGSSEPWRDKPTIRATVFCSICHRPYNLTWEEYHFLDRDGYFPVCHSCIEDPAHNPCKECGEKLSFRIKSSQRCQCIRTDTFNLSDWLSNNSAIAKHNEGRLESAKYRDSVVNINVIPDILEFPVTGDLVNALDIKFKTSEAVVLDKQIREGGQALIYTCRASVFSQKRKITFYAKIYKSITDPKDQYQVLKSLTTNTEKQKGVALPYKLLTNEQNAFVGYLMNVFDGDELKDLFLRKARVLENYSNVNRLALIEIALDLLTKVSRLHDAGIIIGDLNPKNILFKISNTSVKTYIIDTDSFQIGQHPCPGFTPDYTSPEYYKLLEQSQQKGDTKFPLRVLSDDYFALAVLLFQILMLGTHPYARVGGGTSRENILGKQFAFAWGSGKHDGESAPKGACGSIWSHLPGYIQDAFGTTFQKDEEHACSTDRLSTKDWYSLFKRYKDDFWEIISGNAESGELYPSTVCTRTFQGAVPLPPKDQLSEDDKIMEHSIMDAVTAYYKDIDIISKSNIDLTASRNGTWSIVVRSKKPRTLIGVKGIIVGQLKKSICNQLGIRCSISIEELKPPFLNSKFPDKKDVSRRS